MIWLPLSIATAFFNASAAAVVKRNFSDRSAWEIGMIPNAYAGALCVLILPFIDAPPLDAAFWWALGLSVPLLVTALFFQYRAIQLSPLSLTMPYLSFTPAFVIITGFLILGETLNAWGLAGVLSIAVGGYVLNLEPGSSHGFLGPFKAVFREPGSWRMLITAIIFSVAGVLGRLGVMHSSPLFFALTLFPLMGATFVLIGLVSGKARLSSLAVSPGWALLAGLCITLEIITHHIAISMAKAAYMLAVKRLNTLISVIYGGMVFKERNIWVRLAGTVLMIAGVAMIGVLGE
jgi:drug/metabolite transporter (DMT)-like permease